MRFARLEVGMSAALAQLEELKSLNSRIEQFNEQIRKEGPVIDQIQEQRTKAAKLERQVKAGRLRKMSLVRHGAKGKGIHKRKPPKQVGELEAIYDEMDSLEDYLGNQRMVELLLENGQGVDPSQLMNDDWWIGATGELELERRVRTIEPFVEAIQSLNLCPRIEPIDLDLTIG